MLLAVEPIRTTLGYGQVNTILMALVVADLLPDPPEHQRRIPQGILIGLAAAIKLTTAEIASALVRGKQLEILGYSNLEVPEEARHAAYLELVGHACAGRVSFPIETYSLDNVTEAWERQAAGPGAKLIVTI